MVGLLSAMPANPGYALARELHTHWHAAAHTGSTAVTVI